MKEVALGYARPIVTRITYLGEFICFWAAFVLFCAVFVLLFVVFCAVLYCFRAVVYTVFVLLLVLLVYTVSVLQMTELIGELGYELYIPAEQALHVYDKVVPTPGNMYTSQKPQFAPAFGSKLCVHIPRSR